MTPSPENKIIPRPLPGKKILPYLPFILTNDKYLYCELLYIYCTILIILSPSPIPFKDQHPPEWIIQAAMSIHWKSPLFIGQWTLGPPCFTHLWGPWPNFRLPCARLNALLYSWMFVSWYMYRCVCIHCVYIVQQWELIVNYGCSN